MTTGDVIHSSKPSIRRWTSLTGAAALAAGVAAAVSIVGGAVPAADAAVSPVVARPSGMVTSDVLPTVQIDGVVWSQVISANTVYAGGSFANARPAGAAAGTSLTPRANLLSYNLSTGVLNTSFAPSLNGAVRAVAVSPDGTRLYVGGAFTTANGSTRSRIAAYNTATGALVTTFKPAMGTQVNSIVATNTTVYAGGQFVSAAGVTRDRLAAFNASNGALTAWNPNADGNVNAMVLTPDGSKLVIGGAFQNVGGQAEYGLAAVNAVTGAVVPFAANQKVRDAGVNAAIESLRTDGTSIYGTGYVYGTGGNLEGAFSADPSTGSLNWVESCHGDTYDSYPSTSAGVLYVVSHEHFCGDVGGFPQTDTPWVTHRSTAFTLKATGTLQHDTFGGNYADWYGTPSPSLVDWFPDLITGQYTGQGQAAWSITGNSQYIVEGGEFPGVNGAAQQGLVRFAIPSIAPNKQGPRVTTTAFEPNLSAQAPGTVRVAFQANYDRDDQTLTYNVYRNGDLQHPVWTTTQASEPWNRPTLGFTDTGLTPGATYSYAVYASDPNGNTAKGTAVSITLPASGPTQTAYGQAVVADGASPYWPMDEASGSSIDDHAGYNDAQVTGTVTRGASGPVTGVAATTFDGSTGGAYQQSTPSYGPNTFSLEGWFKTTTTSGGEIIGYGTAQTGLSQNIDRNIYMDNSGHLYFDLQRRTITSPLTYNNGQWHQVVATMSSAGTALYVDGARVATGTMTSGQTLFPGYWRVGGDNLSGFTSAPTSNYFAGSIGQVSVFPTALTQSQVTKHFTARSSTATPPTAAFTQSCTNLACAFDSSGSTGSISSYAWKFGDGATSTAANPSHTYASAGSYSVTLTVTNTAGQTGTTSNTVVVSAANVAPNASFSYTTANLVASFNGSASSDPDGTIASYAWSFGDGATSTAASPSHTYAAAGTYPVSLTVTDNDGARNTATQSVTVTAGNVAPTAAFSVSATGLSASFDASASADPDGTIASYAWTFGDGTTGTGVSPSHTYTAAGTYTVGLTVTDNQGATGTASHPVTVTSGNVSPTSAFTSTTSALTANFNGSGSSDPDGSIASYAWTFGDGGTGSGATPSHTYTAGGTYTVTLTVTDNQGATGSVSHSVTVAPTAYATDTFARTVTGGWGSADVGGAWTLSGGAANFSVGGGVGSMVHSAAGTLPGAYLNTVAATNSNSTVDVALNKAATGGGDYVYLIARHTASSDYRLRAKVLSTGAVQVSLTKLAGGTETVLTTATVAGLTYTANTVVHLRLQVVGTSSVILSGKAWTGATEPTAWQITATDSTSPLGAGAPGLLTYLSGSSTNAPVTVAWSNLSVGSTNP